MITVAISRKHFIEQLPLAWQVGMKLSELPDMLVFSGEPSQTRNEEYQLKYPKIFEILTDTEWRIFRMLIARNELGCTTKEIYNQIFSEKRVSSYGSNVVDVHIKAMRKKFGMHQIPFEIATRRGSWGESRRILYPRGSIPKNWE